MNLSARIFYFALRAILHFRPIVKETIHNGIFDSVTIEKKSLFGRWYFIRQYRSLPVHVNCRCIPFKS